MIQFVPGTPENISLLELHRAFGFGDPSWSGRAWSPDVRQDVLWNNLQTNENRGTAMVEWRSSTMQDGHDFFYQIKLAVAQIIPFMAHPRRVSWMPRTLRSHAHHSANPAVRLLQRESTAGDDSKTPGAPEGLGRWAFRAKRCAFQKKP